MIYPRVLQNPKNRVMKVEIVRQYNILTVPNFHGNKTPVCFHVLYMQQKQLALQDSLGIFFMSYQLFDLQKFHGTSGLIEKSIQVSM